MGYRCGPGVTIFDFSDTFLHLFNATTGTINSAQYSIYMPSIEFNSALLKSQSTNFQNGLSLWHNRVVNYICLLTLHSIESVKSNSFVSKF